MLTEGGNVFKDAQGQPRTQRINRADVLPTVKWLERVTGLPLVDNMLGSTGLKDTSGDLDLAVDANAVTKDALFKHLGDYVEANGQQAQDWVRKSGISVHFLTPIAGRADRGFVQTDFMFMTNVPWSKFVLRGDINSQYKGALRNIMINSMAKSMGYKLNQNAGLQDRATNEIITDDPDKVAKLLLNPGADRNDLVSVEKIMAALANDPKREDKIADFKAHMEREGIPFDQPVAESEVSFLARLRDRIVNKGMQPIMEGVRIEHPEDLIFAASPAVGAQQALRGIIDVAKDPTSTTVKWDGKPAIIFGRKPTGEFVLTDKAGFLSKSYDGLATSPEHIEKMMLARGGERSELIQMYRKIFPLLRAATPENMRGYIQGDLLFSNRPTLTQGRFVFQPNTVTYSVDANSDLGRKIADSEVGVVIHTFLQAPGSTAQPIKAAALRPVPGLLILDPSLKEKRSMTLDQNLVKKTGQLITNLGGAMNQLFDPDQLRSRRITNLPDLMKTYINSRVRSGSYDNLVQQFGPWLQAREPAKAPRIFEWANENKEAVAAIFQMFLNLSSLKNSIVRQLDSQAHDVTASINNEPGHEGYVGQGLKFVDRMRFSQANFARNNPDLA